MSNKYKGLTPHNDAQKEEIAKIVLMPGDPLRANFIAKKYLDNPKQVNNVRGMLAFTGQYKGKNITIMGSGMGIPSMGIYSSELYEFYDVDIIIRIGSCAATNKNIKLHDIIIGQESQTKSTYYEQVLGLAKFKLKGNKKLIEQTQKIAKNLNIENKIHIGKIYCGEAFYKAPKVRDKFIQRIQKNKIIGLEMESFALYTNAKRFNKKALTILSVSDHTITGEVTTAKERQNSFTDMMELSLNVAINI